MDEMMLHEWPGNVRELENAIERAVVVGRGRKIAAEDLPISCHMPTAAAQEAGRGRIWKPGDDSLRKMEKAHIQKVLDDNGWQILRSAKILGIDRSTLYNKIKRYGMSRATEK